MFVSRSFADIKHQVLATFIVNILVFGLGGMFGWYSPALPHLQSNRTPLLDGPLSPEATGWVGACMSCGSVFGTLLFGFIANAIGVKKTLLLNAPPLITAWCILCVATRAWHLYVARLCAGLTGGGVFLCVPLFIVETASDNIRGTLNSYLQISCYSGVLLGFIVGSVVDYELYPKIMILFPVLFLCAFVFFPDTPQQLLKQHNLAGAERSLRFYCNSYANDDDANGQREKEFQAQMLKLQQIAEQQAKLPPLSVSDFLVPTVRNNVLNGSLLMSLSHLCGSFVLCNYAATIFANSGSTIDPFVSAIIVSVAQLAGVVTASTMIDRFGRRILMLVSTGGAGCCLLATGLYTYAVRTGAWDVSALNAMPVVGMSLFIYVTAIGMLPVPYVYVAEIFPQRVRRIGCALCTCFLSMVAVVYLKWFPLALAYLDLHWCMFGFAGVAMVGMVYVWFVVQETKGKDVNVVDMREADVAKLDTRL